MLEVYHDVDGYQVRLQRSNGQEYYPKYRAEAKDDTWGNYYEACASTAYDALARLADKSGIDREELLITFGYEGQS